MTTPFGVTHVSDASSSQGEGDRQMAEVESPSVIPEIAFIAAIAADEKLGQDTVILDMAEVFGMVDAFVITNGRNARQVKTLVDEIERQAKEYCDRSPTSIEGMADGSWVLMDYGDVFVHVFLEETRSYYDLEHLWAGAPRVQWNEAQAAHS